MRVRGSISVLRLRVIRGDGGEERGDGGIKEVEETEGTERTEKSSHGGTEKRRKQLRTGCCDCPCSPDLQLAFLPYSVSPCEISVSPYPPSPPTPQNSSSPPTLKTPPTP